MWFAVSGHPFVSVPSLFREIERLTGRQVVQRNKCEAVWTAGVVAYKGDIAFLHCLCFRLDSGQEANHEKQAGFKKSKVCFHMVNLRFNDINKRYASRQPLSACCLT
ncbi:hypothetical protein D3C86_1227790 [compost metagenome]